MTRTTKGRGRTPKRKPSSVEEATAWLRAYAVGMYDQGDGHGVDWLELSQALFATAFMMIREHARGDARTPRLLRKVEVSVYDCLAGNPDDGTPPAITATGQSPAPEPLRPQHAPEPHHRR